MEYLRLFKKDTIGHLSTENNIFPIVVFNESNTKRKHCLAIWEYFPFLDMFHFNTLF